ncbi:hypothetical protein T439DRAFT_358024 [Meredithblackwellia eburnea MCA 4105]
MELTSSSPTSPCALGWGAGTHRGPDVPVEKCLSGGAHSYVTGSSRSVSPSAASLSTSSSSTTSSTSSILLGSSPTDSIDSLTSITPPPAYSSIYPPSPPASPQLAHGAVLIPVPAKLAGCFTNPIHRALSSPSSPIKPVLVTANSSSSDSSDIISLASLSLSDSETSDAEDDNDDTSSILSSRLSSDTISPSPLIDVFPIDSPIHSLPRSAIDLTDSSPVAGSLVGAVVENPAMGTRTLYVAGGTYEHVNLRETVCTVLEKAEEELGCTGVVMCLEKRGAGVAELLHSLMYVGGTVVTGPFKHHEEFILVGLDV